MSRLHKSALGRIGSLIAMPLLLAMMLLTGCVEMPSGTGSALPSADAAQEATPAATDEATAPAVVAAETPAAESPEPAPAIPVIAATVVRVVDGDTAIFSLGGRQERVRFIGVNTPESTTRTEPFGAEASAYTKRKLKVGRRVFLEKDLEERDRYGRLLAYVWLAKPTAGDEADIRAHMFNAWLAIDGYAQQMTIQPNSKYADYFRTFVAEARDADRGLWNPSVLEESAAPPAASPAPAASGGGSSAAYIGNRNTMRFHVVDCSSVSQMNPANQVPLSSRDKAVSAGYVPCGNCRP